MGNMELGYSTKVVSNKQRKHVDNSKNYHVTVCSVVLWRFWCLHLLLHITLFPYTWIPPPTYHLLTRYSKWQRLLARYFKHSRIRRKQRYVQVDEHVNIKADGKTYKVSSYFSCLLETTFIKYSNSVSLSFITSQLKIWPFYYIIFGLHAQKD